MGRDEECESVDVAGREKQQTTRKHEPSAMAVSWMVVGLSAEAVWQMMSKRQRAAMASLRRKKTSKPGWTIMVCSTKKGVHSKKKKKMKKDNNNNFIVEQATGHQQHHTQDPSG